MQGITPFLWFDDQAEEAVAFYTSLFKGSSTGESTRYVEASSEVAGRPVGSIMTIAFQLAGQDFIALNGGPEFTFSPAVSFFVGCDSEEEIETLWEKLSPEGEVFMELGQYPFSEKYGWVQDKYGVGWQLIQGKREQKISPCLLFVGDQAGKAEEAIKQYTALFPNSEIKTLARYEDDEASSEGMIKHATFSLNGQDFVAMDSGLKHAFEFTLGISFMVNCENQDEVDRYWENLSADGDESAQVCGWLKDRYGVSWQIVPTVVNKLLRDSDPENGQRVFREMVKMKKLDITALQQAAEGSLSKR